MFEVCVKLSISSVCRIRHWFPSGMETLNYQILDLSCCAPLLLGVVCPLVQVSVTESKLDACGGDELMSCGSFARSVSFGPFFPGICAFACMLPII